MLFPKTSDKYYETTSLKLKNLFVQSLAKQIESIINSQNSSKKMGQFCDNRLLGV